MKEKLSKLLSEYGSIAITIYFVIFGLVFAGFALAISAGVQVDSAAEGAGTIGAAWLATKLTQPFRIGATILLTPIVARLRPKKNDQPPPSTPDSDDRRSAPDK
jgi:hypothetical protein